MAIKLDPVEKTVIMEEFAISGMQAMQDLLKLFRLRASLREMKSSPLSMRGSIGKHRG